MKKNVRKGLFTLFFAGMILGGFIHIAVPGCFVGVTVFLVSCAGVVLVSNGGE